MRRLPHAVPLVVLALSGLAACATPSAPVPPLYTPAERRAECERHGGWWRLDDLRGDFCEPNGQM
jgi:hypothetical protein